MDSFSRLKYYIYSIVVVIFILTAFISFTQPHKENDEVIFQTLAKKISQFKAYNLQDTDILSNLPPKVYDTQIFFRPPAFMVYLALLYLVLGEKGFYISSLIIYILLCFVLYKTSFLITGSKEKALKTLILAAFSSSFLFSAKMINLDSFLTLMVAASFLFLIIFNKSKKSYSLLLSGIFLAISVLTKYTSFILYPFFLFIIYIFSAKPFRFKNIIIFLLPSLILVGWFFYLFYVYKVPLQFLTSSPDKEMIEKFPFVNYVYHRPFYFYFLNIFLINPIYFLIFFIFKSKVWNEMKESFSFYFYFFLSIVITVISALTLYGIMGGSYQTRYILIAEPFLILLLSLIPFGKKKFFLYLFIIFLVHNYILFLYNSVFYNNAEVFSFFELNFLFSPE